MDRKIFVIAHNIRSLWNVGSLFRTCDAFGVEKIILSGYTATPPRREIAKTAIGADEWIPWEKAEDSLLAIELLKEMGYRIVALEQAEEAMDLAEYLPSAKECLIVGHEVTGVPKEILRVCDQIVHIPMRGQKESLNVAVAAGIALHALASAL